MCVSMWVGGKGGRGKGRERKRKRGREGECAHVYVERGRGRERRTPDSFDNQLCCMVAHTNNKIKYDKIATTHCSRPAHSVPKQNSCVRRGRRATRVTEAAPWL